MYYTKCTGKKQWKANIPYYFSVLRTLEIVIHIRISDYRPPLLMCVYSPHRKSVLPAGSLADFPWVGFGFI